MVLEKKIFIFRQCIFAISSLSPIMKWSVPLLEVQECFVPSLAEIDPLVFFFKLSIYLYYFHVSPLAKGPDSLFEQIFTPFCKGCFVPKSSLVEIGPVYVVLVNKLKMWKVFRQTLKIIARQTALTADNWPGEKQR